MDPNLMASMGDFLNNPEMKKAMEMLQKNPEMMKKATDMLKKNP